MKLSALAARDMTAQKRLVAAATALAQAYGTDIDIPMATRGTTSKRLVAGMKQREAIADLLGQLVDIEGVSEGVTLAELESLPGVGAATVAKVQAYMESR